MTQQRDDTCEKKHKLHHKHEAEPTKFYICPCGLKLHVMNSLQGEDYHPAPLEEIANILTHLIPALFTFYFISDMLNTVANTPLEVISAWVYGIGAILLFSVSTLYHVTGLVFGKKSKWNHIFLHLDYTMIYAFSAACYTPWLILVEIGEENIYGRILLGVIWVIALFGVFNSALKLVPGISQILLLYTIGTIAIMYLAILYRMIQSEQLSMRVISVLEGFLGIVSYGIGFIFFKQDGRLPFAHSIWHIFVACAAGFHLHAVHVHVMALQ